MTKKKPNKIVLEKVDSIRAYDENANTVNVIESVFKEIL
jgi:hypothetical protein